MTERTAWNNYTLDQIRRLADKVDGDLPFRTEGPLLFVSLELSQVERHLIADALTALYDIEANR